MTLDVEGIVYGGLDVQKSLGRTWGFESLLFSLSPSDRLVRVLRTLVRTLVIDVLSRQAEGGIARARQPERALLQSIAANFN